MCSNESPSLFGAPDEKPSESDRFCQNLRKLWLNESTADVVFFVINPNQEPKHFPAHKCLLAVGSSEFHRLFFSDDSQNDNHVNVFDVSPEVFQVFLSSFYQPNIAVSEQNVSNLIYLAKEYNARSCMAQCELFLKSKLTPDNVCYALQLATLCNDKEMYRSCLMVIENNFQRVLASNGFLCSNHTIIKHILLANLRNRDEFAIFEAYMHWAKTSCEREKVTPKMSEWRTELGECFNLIRFDAMTPLQFMKCETIYPVFTEQELTEIKVRIISHAEDKHP